MAKKSPRKKGRPLKEGQKKDDRMIVALEPQRKRVYVKAATQEGMELSEWVRYHLDRVADQVLRDSNG